jgi:hypothetical protein
MSHAQNAQNALQNSVLAPRLVIMPVSAISRLESDGGHSATFGFQLSEHAETMQLPPSAVN